MYRRLAALASVAVLALAACSGGGSGDKLKIGGGFAPDR
jgi:hypothetical protein